MSSVVKLDAFDFDTNLEVTHGSGAKTFKKANLPCFRGRPTS